MHVMSAADIPLSAYDIADAASRKGAPLVPNQVYRTLARLIGQRRVRRIQSLNAYLCREGGADACLICDDCRRVSMFDVPVLQSSIGELAGAADFALEECVVEVHGHCADCRTRAQASRPASPN